MKELNGYTQLSQKLTRKRQEYKNLVNGECMFGEDVEKKERLKNEIYKIDGELKEIDEVFHNSYKHCLSGKYHPNHSVGDYKPLLNISLFFKVVMWLCLACLVINIILPYLPDVKPIDNDSFPVELFMPLQ